MDTTTMATAATMPAPCMTIGGRPVYPAAIITPEAYEAAWKARAHGTRTRSVGYFAHYVSIHEESDCGVEIEVSALVDLRPGRADLDDYRCRLVGAAEVELDDATLGDLRDRLVHAAEALCR